MARRSRSSVDIRAEIHALQAALQKAEEKEGDRLGALAIKAKLHEVEATDAELIAGLERLAKSFPKRKPNEPATNGAAVEPAGTGDAGSAPKADAASE